VIDARAVIAAIRAGTPPEPAAIRAFALGLANGAVSDAQAGAFAMAVCLRGLGEAGRVALTLGMRDSGAVLAWDLPGPVLDKHSTGGIGDAVSIPLAPTLAACGAFVPMVSGRGLGHTGGTLDKLESIPGLRTAIAPAALRAQIAAAGCAIVAASAEIAPADRRLYAIRDVTATVESIDLITASILSKKLAAGLGALVLDVKTGSGAFMATEREARDLARALVATARGAGCPTDACITGMDAPLLPVAGNALEIAASMEVLTGAAPHPALRQLVEVLGGRLLVLGGLAGDEAGGAAAIARALDSGRAAEVFGAMVARQGGPADFVARWRAHLPVAPVQAAVPAPAGGVIERWDTRTLGLAIVALGGGRAREGDAIDHRVGLAGMLPVGAPVASGEPVAIVHAADEAGAARARQAVAEAVRVGPGPAAPRPLIHGWV